MKLTHKQSQELLKMVLAQVVELVADDSTEAEKEFNPQTAIDNFIKLKKPSIIEDYEKTTLAEKIKNVAGEFGGKLKGYIRKASGNTLKQADLENKTDEEVVNLLVEHLTNTKDASANDLRDQIKKLVDDHKKEIETLQETHATNLKAEQSKFTDLKVEDYLQTLVNGLPLGQGDAGVRAKALKAALLSEYGYNWDDVTKKLELREKDKPESPVIKDNIVLDVKTFAENYFKSLGMVQTDTRQTTAANAMGNQQMQNAAQNNTFFAGSPEMPQDLAGALQAIENAQ